MGVTGPVTPIVSIVHLKLFLLHRKAERFNSLYDIIFDWVTVNYGAACGKINVHAFNTSYLLYCSLHIALAVVTVHTFYRNGPRSDVASPTTAR